MALINFDCPECGHNLEVDEGGAGFIVKCPECGNPLQIPQLPKSRRLRKLAVAVGTLLAIVLLVAANLFLWSRARNLGRELNDTRQALAETVRDNQALIATQDGALQKLSKDLAAAQTHIRGQEALAQAALAAVETAESLAGELETATRKLLEKSPDDRGELLRKHMRQRVEASRNSLPAAPSITDTAPGRGIQGRLIVFPVLPGPDGQALRENAEITGVDGEQVSVKFLGGTASYKLTELHPGVAAFLPVDPLLVLPRSQWNAEVVRIQQTANAQRDEKLKQLRDAIQAQLPAE
ncbi:MAG: hypothetical protein AB7V14_04170 [Kiritimatiellia bacterium]